MLGIEINGELVGYIAPALLNQETVDELAQHGSLLITFKPLFYV